MGEVVQPCPPRKESGSVEVKPPKFSRLLSASVAACPRLFQLSGPGFAIVAAGQEGRGLALSLERFIADPRDALAKGGQVDGLAAESVHAHLTLACLSQGDGLRHCRHVNIRTVEKPGITFTDLQCGHIAVLDIERQFHWSVAARRGYRADHGRAYWRKMPA
jgi:hypothetical protein